MKAFIKENTHRPRNKFFDFGWGNGYVVIPKGNPLYGKNYNEIHKLIPDLEVNGGLTFSEKASNILNWKELPEGSKDSWVVGFDTSHLYDTLKKWTKENVMKETLKLKKQLLKYSKTI